MSGPKHTPEACRTCGGWGRIDADEKVCPYCLGTGDYPVEKHIRLERAAPRLAAALKDALAGLEAARQHHGMNTGILEDKARAALREAGADDA